MIRRTAAPPSKKVDIFYHVRREKASLDPRRMPDFQGCKKNAKCKMQNAKYRNVIFLRNNEPGEPNGVEIFAGQYISHCQRRLAAKLKFEAPLVLYAYLPKNPCISPHLLIQCRYRMEVEKNGKALL
jgi:hypothetical protein